MKLFLDSANITDIRNINDYGVISGVEANLSSIAREGRGFTTVISEIARTIDGTVFAGVVSPEHEKMTLEAHELTKLGKRLEIQIPMCAEGLKTIKILKKDGVRTNCTLIFTTAQAHLAALAGASYINISVGGLYDSGINGVKVIASTSELFRLCGIDCEIVASGLHSPLHVMDCARAGAHIAIVSPDVVMQMTTHPLTTTGMEKFTSDWDELFSKL